MKFQEMNINPAILKALAEEGYTQPTPIQEQAIPQALNGRDLLGCAQTGTGKTAAFAIPVLHQLSKAKGKGHHNIRCLVLTPTRELAIQIGDSFSAYGKYTHLKHTVIFGGVPQGKQTQILRAGVDILVATPGRLLDLVQQRYINLADIEILVLDEADRMLDMGFIHDVKKVLAIVPERKQTLFFSATMPPEIQKLASGILHQPAQVTVTPVSSTVEVIQQSVYFTDKKEKKNLLIHLLQDADITRSLVFTRTKHGADKLVKVLQRNRIPAAAIHGNKSQNARQRALSEFKDSKVRVLVATDIAARGIDIDELPHVVNYDLPEVAETYVHRIGRTGRAGADGIAIAFCDSEEKDYLKGIQKLIGLKIPVIEDHPYQPTNSGIAAPPAEPRRPQHQKRSNSKKNKTRQHGNRW